MSQFFAMLVRNGPGMIALTRTFGPRASASPTVIALTPAFAAAYGTMSAVGRTAPVLLTLMIEPPSSRGHSLADERAEAKRPLQVDAEHLVPLLLGDRAEAFVERRDAGVVDEHIDAPEFAVGRLDEMFQLIPVAHVAGECLGTSPARPECRGHVFAGRELPADDDHVSTGAGIGRRDRQTESAGGAGDERDAPGQVEQFVRRDPPVGAAGARCQPAWTRRRAPWSRVPPRASE